MPFGTNDGMRAQPNMGSGMIQSASELMQLRPSWEYEYTNGLTNKQFSQWVQDPEILDRYRNAPKLMPANYQGGGNGS